MLLREGLRGGSSKWFRVSGLGFTVGFEVFLKVGDPRIFGLFGGDCREIIGIPKLQLLKREP